MGAIVVGFVVTSIPMSRKKAMMAITTDRHRKPAELSFYAELIRRLDSMFEGVLMTTPNTSESYIC